MTPLAPVTDGRLGERGQASERADLVAHRDEDARLVSAIGDGDTDALVIVYERHADAVYRMACRYCSPDDAADVTHDVFLRLWRGPERFDAERGSLRTFLTVQGRGRALDVVRSDGARRSREGLVANRPAIAPIDVGVEEAVTAGEARAEVLRSLADLPDVERIAISLAYYGGFTYREVAKLLDQPEGTIKGRIRSGLRHLRQELTGPNGDHRGPGLTR